MEAVARLFRGGVPYGPDLRRLEEAFGVPKAGTVIGYAALEAAIGCSWRSSRFRGVVNAWRKRVLREANVDSACDAGTSLRFLTAEERVDVTRGDVKATARKARRTYVRAESIDPLDIQDVRKRDEAALLKRVSRAIYVGAAVEVKALLPPPVKSLPVKS